jgi:hypothetical protein
LSLIVVVTGCTQSGNVSVNVNDNPAIPRDDPERQTDDPGDSADHARLVQVHDSSVVPICTLPGFTMNEDGTSRVFVEVSADVPVSESKDKLLLSYRFQGVTVPERVNRLPIPTTHFETPVSSIQVIQVQGAAELRILLRQDAAPRTRLKRSSTGTVLSVDFPRWRPGQEWSATTDQVDADPTPVQN